MPNSNLSAIKKVEQAAQFLFSRIHMPVENSIVLGSGLGSLADKLTDQIRIPYQEIPFFARSHVQGHGNCLVSGYLEGKNLLVMQGRFHYYEGYPIEDVVFPIRVLQTLGIKNIIFTNAAGGVKDGFAPGDLMLITDHLNMMGVNPLRGENIDEWGPRFPDMTGAYDPHLCRLAREAAVELGIDLKEGVYAAFCGPSYETPAEIHFLDIIGVGAVGMSTVPEVIVANHARMNVLAISLISNIAAKKGGGKIRHEDVLEVGEGASLDFIALLESIINKLP